jgi:DNA-binding GntR family transcriptional regulator
MDLRNQSSEFALQTAAEKAYKAIRRNILDGSLPPGANLPRRKMSKLAGVSVIPVIEAMQQLEADGLVRSKPRWGSYVTPVTREEILGNFALREAIECHVVRILAGTLTAASERRLRELAREIDEGAYTSEEDKARTWDSHYRFHRALAEETGFESLVKALDKTNLYSLLVRAMNVRRAEDDLPPDWHGLVIDAIAQRDPAHAEDVMRRHVQNGLNRLLEYHESPPDQEGKTEGK